MRRILWPLAFGLAGIAILLGLGVWQIDRLRQKEALLAEMEARIGSPPGALPLAPGPGTDRFRAVALSGRFTEADVLVFSSHPELGPGSRLISIFVTEDGRRVLVDRGFLSEAERALPRSGGKARITGHLLWPQEADRYTPPPDPRTGMWYARDVPALARRLEAEPLLVVLATTDEMTPPALPMPVNLAAIPNNHLEYAITWFLLAAVWAGMTLLLVWRIRRQGN